MSLPTKEAMTKYCADVLKSRQEEEKKYEERVYQEWKICFEDVLKNLPEIIETGREKDIIFEIPKEFREKSHMFATRFNAESGTDLKIEVFDGYGRVAW